MGDTSHGTADNRAACSAHEIEPLSPLPEAVDPTVAKAAFTLDLEACGATCPAGHSTTTVHGARDEQGRPVLRFHFPRAVGEVSPLFTRCVHIKTEGRTLTSHSDEELLKAAGAQQASAEFKDTPRNRAPVQRKIADLYGPVCWLHLSSARS